MNGDQGGFQSRWGERADTNPLLQDAQRQYQQIQALRQDAPMAGADSPFAGGNPFVSIMAEGKERYDEVMRQRALAEALKRQGGGGVSLAARYSDLGPGGGGTSAGGAEGSDSADAAAANAAADAANAVGLSVGEAMGSDSSGDAGGGGGGGGKVICTQLHAEGLVPQAHHLADQAYGLALARQRPDTYKGYRVWSDWVVRHLATPEKSPRVSKIVRWFFVPVSTCFIREIAYRRGAAQSSSYTGWLIVEGWEIACTVIGAVRKLWKGSNR